MNERARGRKEESSRRRRRSCRRSFSFTACFFATLACLIQLPNSIEAGWTSKSDSECTNKLVNNEINSFEGDCDNRYWAHIGDWKGYRTNEYTTYGECNPTCGDGTRTVYRKYDFYRMTGCEKKDKRLRRCTFTSSYSTHIASQSSGNCNAGSCPPPPSPPSPPPPGSNGVPTVAIGVQALQVTDRDFDFQITVSDNDCSDVTNCLGTPFLVNANTAKGLQCDAYVASSSTDTSCTYATSSD